MAENKSERSGFICFRCGREINWDEKFISLEGNIEVLTRNKTINCIENCMISSLCFSCAIILLNEAVINKNMIMPQPKIDLLETACEIDDHNSANIQDAPQLKLTAKEHLAGIISNLKKVAACLDIKRTKNNEQ